MINKKQLETLNKRLRYFDYTAEETKTGALRITESGNYARSLIVRIENGSVKVTPKILEITARYVHFFASIVVLQQIYSMVTSPFPITTMFSFIGPFVTLFILVQLSTSSSQLAVMKATAMKEVRDVLEADAA